MYTYILSRNRPFPQPAHSFFCLFAINSSLHQLLSNSKHTLSTMVVRLRLQRFGRTHSPFYRMVAADARAPRDGRFLEIVGTYNPIATRAGIKEIRLKTDRLKYWLSVGAQPSNRVGWILGKFGILPPTPPRYSPQNMIPKKDRDEKKKS